jgi:hypothetical protein
MKTLVQACSPDEASRIIAQLGDDPSAWPTKMVRGYVDAVCREADGSVAWEAHQPNLFTDHGRRRLFHTGFTAAALSHIFTSPSQEPPAIGRDTLLDDGNASSSQSAACNPTYDSLTLTKTFTTTFAAPTTTRSIGTIGFGVGRGAAYGVSKIYAYTRLSPAKTQTTTQTLEVQYRLVLTPII